MKNYQFGMLMYVTVTVPAMDETDARLYLATVTDLSSVALAGMNGNALVGTATISSTDDPELLRINGQSVEV
jgi:hypothetical protein